MTDRLRQHLGLDATTDFDGFDEDVVAEMPRPLGTPLPNDDTPPDDRAPDADNLLCKPLLALFGGGDFAAKPTEFAPWMAGRCDRQIGYRLAGIEPTNSPDVTARWVGLVRRYVLGEYLNVAQRTLGGFGVQTFDAPTLPHLTIRTATAESWHHTAVHVVVAGDRGYRTSIGVTTYAEPEGPRWEDIAHGALRARNADTDALAIVVLTVDPVSPAHTGLDPLQRIASQWTYTRDEYLTVCAQVDQQREQIERAIADGYLPRRHAPEMPDTARVVNPLAAEGRGAWQQTDGDTVIGIGSYWGCGTCRWRTDCARRTPDTEPIDTPTPKEG